MKKRADQSGSNVSLSNVITPFLDMAFQLLFFFIITFKPPINEGKIDFNFAPPEGGGSASNSNSLQIDEKVVIRIQLLADINGNMDGISIVVKKGKENSQPDSLAAGEEGYMATLKADLVRRAEKYSNEKGKEPDIRIEGAKTLKSRDLIDAMSTAMSIERDGRRAFPVINAGEFKEPKAAAP